MTVQVRPLPLDINELVFDLGGRKLVLVEGPTDAEIFDTWYEDHLDDLLFVAAGGHDAIRSTVDEIATARPDIEAYGIRDRDFCEDATVTKSLNDSHEQVFRLTRYAIENYLLDPQAVFREMKAFLGRKCPVKTSGEVEEKLLVLCKELATVMAANWVLIDERAATLPIGFDPADRDAIIHWVSNQHGCSEVEAELLVAERIARIELRMDSLEAAHRCTNGKHLLHQVYSWLTVVQRSLRKDHLMRLLCARIKDSIGIPDDIRQIVEHRILNRA